jgi:flagellar hook assembly protein FlgD
MLKKFLAALGLVAMLSTSTAFAIDPAPGGNNPPADGTVITNFKASTYTVNPTKGETADVTFTLLSDATMFAYVLNSNEDVVTTFVNDEAANPATLTPKGAVKYTWTAKAAGGSVLADGVYKIKAFAKVGGVLKDSFVQNITITSVNKLAPKITGLKFDPATFSPSTGESTDAYFTTSMAGFLTVKVLQGSSAIRTFDGYNDTYYDAGSFSISWDGKDSNDNVVPDGNYKLQVTASRNGGADLEVNTVTTPVAALTTGSATAGSVKNFYLDPASAWSPIKGGLDIHYQLNQTVKSLNIQAKQTSGNITKVIKVLSDKNIDTGYYTETWDGTDDVGNYVDAGTWTISIIADGATVTKNVTVKYVQPAVVEAFVSKDAFDPSKNELQNFVFKIDAKAVVTVEAYQGAEKEAVLVKDQVVQKNNWYTVAWDGRDMDGAQVDNGADWKFKVTAKNPTAEDLLASKTVSFEIANDTVNEKKANVTNDTTSPVVYDDQQSSAIEFNYSLDQAASVFMAVYEGNSTGGKAKATLLDYVAQDYGDHNVSWDGRDANGKMLVDGTYTYKIIAKVGTNYKETEVGTFVIGNAGEYISTQPPVVIEPPVVVEPPVVEPPYVTPNCGGYSDTKFVVNQNYEQCQAIAWVTEQGIFKGYNDGSFGLNTPISRTEVLKVVLKSFQNVTLLPSDGSNQGFWDADASAWYMTYIRTAKFYSMLQGYADGSAGVNKHVSRAEFLKFALKASSSFTGYVAPSYSFSYYADVDVNNTLQAWYKDFAGVAYDMGFFGYNYANNGSKVYLSPDKEITRGEVALILYKMYNNYLLGYGPVYPMMQ